MTSLLAKVTFVVTEIILLGDDIKFLMVKISVAAEITFKVDFFSGQAYFCSGLVNFSRVLTTSSVA